MSCSLFLTMFLSFLNIVDVPMSRAGDGLVEPFLSTAPVCPGALLSTVLGVTLGVLLCEQGIKLE